MSSGIAARAEGSRRRPPAGATVPPVDLIETLRTTGAAREFRPDPVPDAVVHRVLDTARFAPNGGNRQAWRVVVVKDGATSPALITSGGSDP